MAINQAQDEIEHDCWKTYRKIQACFDGNLEPNSASWLSVTRLAERLREEANRAFAIAKQLETLAEFRASNPSGLPGG